MVSNENKQTTVYRLRRLLFIEYIHICMHVITMNEKGHEFGTEQGGVYRRVWRKKKEGEMM